MSCNPGSPCYTHSPSPDKGCGIDLCNIVTTGTDYVYYNGPNLPCINVATCETLTVALQKIDHLLCPETLAITILNVISNNTTINNIFCGLVNNCIPTSTTTSSTSSTTSTTSSTTSSTTTECPGDLYLVCCSSYNPEGTELPVVAKPCNVNIPLIRFHSYVDLTDGAGPNAHYWIPATISDLYALGYTSVNTLYVPNWALFYDNGDTGETNIFDALDVCASIYTEKSCPIIISGCTSVTLSPTKVDTDPTTFSYILCGELSVSTTTLNFGDSPVTLCIDSGFGIGVIAGTGTFSYEGECTSTTSTSTTLGPCLDCSNFTVENTSGTETLDVVYTDCSSFSKENGVVLSLSPGEIDYICVCGKEIVYDPGIIAEDTGAGCRFTGLFKVRVTAGVGSSITNITPLTAYTLPSGYPVLNLQTSSGTTSGAFSGNISVNYVSTASNAVLRVYVNNTVAQTISVGVSSGVITLGPLSWTDIDDVVVALEGVTATCFTYTITSLTNTPFKINWMGCDGELYSGIFTSIGESHQICTRDTFSTNANYTAVLDGNTCLTTTTSSSTTAAPVYNFKVFNNLTKRYSINSVFDFLGQFYTIGTGSFPVAPLQSLFGQGVSSNAVSVVITNSFPVNMQAYLRLYKNNVSQQTLSVTAPGTYTFSLVAFAPGDEMKIILSST